MPNLNYPHNGEAESAEKSSDSADKSSDSQMHLSDRQSEMLSVMETGVEYSADEIAEKIGLKGSRTRQLLGELVNMKLIRTTAATRNRRYVKVTDGRVKSGI